MTVDSESQPSGRPLFPFNWVAIKIAGDGILTAVLVRLDGLSAGDAASAVAAAVALSFVTGTVSGINLLRSGHDEIWHMTAVACLGAMAVLLFLHGAFIVAAALGYFAHWRWRRLTDHSAPVVDP